MPGGLLASVRAPFVSPFTTSYAYDAAGRPLANTHPNGATASYSYDNAGRLTLVENKTPSGTVISRHQYTLDNNSNRTAADEQNGSFTGVTTFTYDELNRLTEAVYPNNQSVNYRRVTYGYNDSGDRTSLQQWTGSPGAWTQYGSTVGYSYDTAGRMTAAGSVSYCYDNNGNQTRRGGSTCTSGGDTFSYDAENRMTQAVISGATSSYTYNGAGVRTRKVSGGVTTDYLQDVNAGLPRVAVEQVGSNRTYYIYGKRLLARLDASQVVQYYHYDGSGNVRAISDAAGTVIERYDYDAFGSLRNTPSGVTNDRRFTGEQLDAESGYTFLRARYYDPAIGRFTGRDAVEGGNRYAYTGNNPVSRTDASGYSWNEDNDEWPATGPGLPPGWNTATGGWSRGCGPTGCQGATTVTVGTASPSSGGSLNGALHRIIGGGACNRPPMQKFLTPCYWKIDLPSVYANTRLAQQHPGNLAWLGWMVRPGGEWDFKKDGGYPKYENFGNWHFGVVGAATGTPTDILYAGAAFVQCVTNGGDFCNPIHDDPNDSFWIALGIQWYFDWFLSLNPRLPLGG